MLKGMGVAMGLPLLEAMAPVTLLAKAAKTSAKHPVRVAVLYMANGVNPHAPCGRQAERI